MNLWQGLRTITKKTIFLLALAMAKRVGELQALSWVVPSSGDDLVLSYLPYFVAKTESPSSLILFLGPSVQGPCLILLMG